MFDLGKIFGRNQKRELERQMCKQGATQEEIDYAVFCRDNAERATAIFKRCVSDMADLGTKMISKINYLPTGAIPETQLTGMTLQDKKQREAMMKLVEKKTEELEKGIADIDVEEATKGENSVIDKIEEKVVTCSDCLAGNDHMLVAACKPSKQKDSVLNCEYCDGLIKIANPTGNCNHVRYPEYVNKDFKKTDNQKTDATENTE